MIFDFVFIAVLILANGFFAAAEMAVVSARQVRLQARAEDGDSRARRALKLRDNPAEFLATVQVGITLVATMASAIGGLEAARVERQARLHLRPLPQVEAAVDEPARERHAGVDGDARRGVGLGGALRERGLGRRVLLGIQNKKSCIQPSGGGPHHRCDAVRCQ